MQYDLQQAQTYEEIKKLAKRSMAFSIIGFFIGGLIFGTLAFSRANKALDLMQQYNLGHEFAGKLKFAKVMGIIDVILALLIIFGRIF